MEKQTLFLVSTDNFLKKLVQKYMNPHIHWKIEDKRGYECTNFRCLKYVDVERGFEAGSRVKSWNCLQICSPQKPCSESSTLRAVEIKEL